VKEYRTVVQTLGFGTFYGIWHEADAENLATLHRFGENQYQLEYFAQTQDDGATVYFPKFVIQNSIFSVECREVKE
jgi:hypothetical protein